MAGLFFFNDTSTTEIYTFSLHDALPIYRELMDTQHFYGFIVVDHLGRAYHPILGGDIARYDPRTDKLERLKQTIDGQPPTPETRLALTPNPDPINWDISPDGETLYAQPMTGNALYAYDLSSDDGGDTLAGRTVGTLVPGAKSVDCRALCVGRSGTVRSEEHTSELQSRQYLVCRLLLEKKNVMGHGSVERVNG